MAAGSLSPNRTSSMTPNSADKKALGKDLLLLLGLPILFLTSGAWYFWLKLFPTYISASDEAVFDLAAGTLDWKSSKAYCDSNPQLITFSPDHSLMTITYRRVWSDTLPDSERVAVYDISEHSPSYIRGQIRGETR